MLAWVKDQVLARVRDRDLAQVRNRDLARVRDQYKLDGGRKRAAFVPKTLITLNIGIVDLISVLSTWYLVLGTKYLEPST